jgi:regulatory protein
MSNKAAYFYIVRLLSARDYSEHKLREKLKTKKFPADEVESAIEEVKTKGYLREEAYTEARIKGFMHKGYSVNYIRQKLSQEKLTVENESIQDVFGEHRVSQDDQIERLARKKLGQKQVLDFDLEGKILRFLISKGHDFGTSKKVLKKLKEELKSPEGNRYESFDTLPNDFS